MADERDTKKVKLVTVDPSNAPSKVTWMNIFTKNTKQSAAVFERILNFKPQSHPYDEIWIELQVPEKDSTNISFHVLSEQEEERGLHVGAAQLSVFVKDLVQYHEFVKDIVKVVQEPTRQHWGGFQAIYGVEGVELSVLEMNENWTKAEHSNGHAEKTKAEDSKENSDSSHSGICHLEIPFENAERVEKFYTDVFGWTFAKKGEWSFFRTNDPQYPLSGTLLPSDFRITHPIVHLRVSNVSEALQRVKEHGGQIVKEEFLIGEGIGYNGVFKDTEGNVLAVYAKFV